MEESITGAREGAGADLFGDVAVEPVSPAVAYLGGKKRLAERLVRRIDSARPRLYAEPFVGMGGVFLRRRFRAPVEVINDKSEDVITFFRILQHHYVAFVDMLRFQLTSRSEFERLTVVRPETLTDLQRAARFLYLQACAWSGKVAGRNYAADVWQGGAFNVLSIVPRLEAVHERLAGVAIERLDYAEFIDRYDREGALFYLDPPYWGGENDYGKGLFDRADFARLAEQLAAIKGRFILSINDVAEIREIFAPFTIEPVSVRYSVGPNDQQAAELIISGGVKGAGG